MNSYAKVVVKGSPITKSNFKLSNINGRAILPYNTGKYYDRYAIYEEQIAYEARLQNPKVVLTESLIAILHVYYKSQKRHPDTTNITKSIFDGIEKSGLIINDSQIRKLIIEEDYDSDNPRFELELFGESTYSMEYTVKKNSICNKPIEYSPPCNKKKNISLTAKKETTKNTENKIHNISSCYICGKKITKSKSISINKGTALICYNCLNKI